MRFCDLPVEIVQDILLYALNPYSLHSCAFIYNCMAGQVGFKATWMIYRCPSALINAVSFYHFLDKKRVDEQVGIWFLRHLSSVPDLNSIGSLSLKDGVSSNISFRENAGIFERTWKLMDSLVDYALICHWQNFMQILLEDMEGLIAHPRHSRTLRALNDHFIRCCKEGNVETIRLLHRKGVVNLHGENGFDNGPDSEGLLLAVKHGHVACVAYLLTEAGGKCTNACLEMAAQKGHLLICKMLLEHSKLSHFSHSSSSALTPSFTSQTLISSEFESQKQPNISKLASIAAEFGHLEIVKYLYGLSADLKYEEDYALRWSLYRGHFHVASFILSLEETSIGRIQSLISEANDKMNKDIARFFARCGYPKPTNDRLKGVNTN